MNPNKSSTQQQTFDPYNLRGRLPMTPVWKDPHKSKRRIQEVRTIKETVETTTGETYFRTYAADGYPYYIDPNNDPAVYLKRPNPPSPEMVQRAQPYRADTLQELEAVIKYPAKAIDV